MRRFHTSSLRRKNPYYFYDLQMQCKPYTIAHRTFDPLANAPAEPMRERVSRVFGALGSREESKKEAQLKGITVAGISVPSKPEEPTNCCMSGCVNCVWELYKDEIEEWKHLRNQARSVLMQPKYRHVKWPPLLGPEPVSRRNGTDGSAKEESAHGAKQQVQQEVQDEEDENSGINTGISVFIETEKKIRARKQAQQQAAAH